MKYTKNKIVEGFIPNQTCLVLKVGTWSNKGIDINVSKINNFINRNRECTTIVFNGGDDNPDEINQIAYYIRNEFPRMNIAWVTNEDCLSSWIKLPNFNYIKMGSVDNSVISDINNGQRLYKVRKVKGGKYKLFDITDKLKNE